MFHSQPIFYGWFVEQVGNKMNGQPRSFSQAIDHKEDTFVHCKQKSEEPRFSTLGAVLYVWTKFI